MDPVFAICAGVAVVSALTCVTRRNPVYSAAWLLVTFLSVAVVFLKLSAPFLAAIHVLVYTGAILVLFLFVIMLLNLRDDELGEEYPLGVRAGVGVLSAGLFGVMAWAAWADPALSSFEPPKSETYGSVADVGRLLFVRYALPFEIVSLLIIVAMFGAIVLAKRKLWVDGTEGAP
jgi:NADH-quinone oxidoreductase subunit J